MSPFQTFNQLPCVVEGGCLAYSQGLNSTVASQYLDRILPIQPSYELSFQATVTLMKQWKEEK